MARINRSAYSFLGVSVVTTLLVAACGGGNDQGVTNNDQTGGVVGASTKATGGKAAGTGGRAATGGKAATGGSVATATGGKAATTGGVPSTAATTGGAPAGTGGAPAGTGGVPASTGGTSGTAGGASATGGSGTPGGASATGGSGTPGGASATGGKSGTTGGASATGGSGTPGGASATGGSGTPGGASATGGRSSTGGSSTAGGASATGGSAATGGGSSLAACPVDNSNNDAFFGEGFCVPTNPDLSLVQGTLTFGSNPGLIINANSGIINITGTPPFTGALTLSKPFTTGNCKTGQTDNGGGGLDASAYTGIQLQLTNSSTTTDTTLVMYIADQITAGGTSYYVVASDTISIPHNTTNMPVTIRWADLVLSCALPNGATFDKAHILAIGLGFTATAPVQISVSNVVYSTT